MAFPVRRAVTCVALALLLALPTVAAQMGDVKYPVQEPFEHTLMVYGRVLDVNGTPASNIDVEVGVDGLQGVKVVPKKVTTRCTGDFAVSFPVGTLTPGAKAFVRVLPDQGADDEGKPLALKAAQARGEIDTHFRRADLTLKLEEDWPFDCQDMSSLWPHRLTVWGRIVNGTDPFERDGTRLSATPVMDRRVNLTIEVQEGVEHGTQWEVLTDARGDFIWSWVFEDNITQGRVRAYLDDALVFNETWDGDPMRLVVANVDIGQGPPPTEGSGTPGPGALPLAAALGVAALLAGRRRG